MFAWPEFIENRSIGCPITPLKVLNVRVIVNFTSTATYNIVLLYEERIKLDLKD